MMLWVVNLVSGNVDFSVILINRTDIYGSNKTEKTIQKMIDLENIEITPQHNILLQKVKDGENILLLGDAGTGKSTTLGIVVNLLNSKDISYKACCPTAMAAVNLTNNGIKASTIHSLFGFPPKTLLRDSILSNIAQNKEELWNLHNYDVLIIDEVSMLTSYMFDAINAFYQFLYDSEQPFAGKQLILTGDLYQLPPIIEQTLHKQSYTYFFDSMYYKQCDFHIENLTKIYRQTDPTYVNFLNKIRHQTMTMREVKELSKLLLANKVDDDALKLGIYRKYVDQVNHEKLEKLSGNWIKLEALESWKFDPERNPFPVSPVLDIKKGARVMIRANDKALKYQNGSMGTLVDRRFDGILEVELDSGELVELDRFDFKKFDYRRNPETGKIEEKMTTMSQYAINPGYASTVHKSQGATLNEYFLDIGQRCFCESLFYVGFSRGTDLNKIGINREIKADDITVNPRVIEFYQNNGLL